MKIATKITFSFLLIILLFMSIAMPIMYFTAKKNLSDAVFAHLVTTSEARADHVNEYLEMHEVIVEQLSESIVLEEFLLISREAPDYAEKFAIATERLEKTQRVNKDLFCECFIMNADGIIVASSRKASVGMDRSGGECFLGVRKSAHIRDVHYCERIKKVSLAFSTPIVNRKTEEFLGVVVNCVCLKALNEITSNRIGLGKTGETYLVNRDGYMITQSRFIRNAPLELKINTPVIGKGIEHTKEFGRQAHEHIYGTHKHNPILYIDYRGNKVLGTFARLNRTQWYLVAEMDANEAFAPLRKLDFIFLAIMFSALALTWLAGRFAAGLIAEPIYQLRKSIEVVGQGELDYKVGMKTEDEIGDLSRDFDKMTGSLKKTTTSIAKLELEVTERKKAEEEAKKAAQIKSEFISMVSHELRTPLTVIKEGIAMTLDGLAGPLNDEQRDFLDAAKRNVDRLTRLINNILDFQKLESGKVVFNIEKNDINETVRVVAEEMGHYVKEKGLDLILKLNEKLPMARFDKDKIIQVLINLINNSVKFTDKGSITISTAQEGNDVGVSVKDTGIGIEKEDMPRLFHKFDQLMKTENRKTGGSGLGLAISKEIIATHKGKIWAESEPGRGTTFYFVLPVVEQGV